MYRSEPNRKLPGMKHAHVDLEKNINDVAKNKQASGNKSGDLKKFNRKAWGRVNLAQKENP
jgi:hypothetical protein